MQNTPMIEWTREVRELADLALARFAALTESELKLLCAVTTGGLADCGHPTDDNYEHPENHPENHPDSAELWDLERVISAELIRWLCVNRDAARLVDPRGIQVRAARIDGQLDLSHASVGFPLDLAKCRIISPVNLSFAQLDALTFNGSVIAGIVSQGLTVRGDIDFQKGFRAKGEVNLIGADVGGSLECDGGNFANPGGYALNADGVRVKGDVFLRDGFRAEGEVRLLGADVGGNLECDGGNFANADGFALYADGVRVKGDVFLRVGFSAEGEVRMLGMDIGGDLDCTGGKFAKTGRLALNVERAKVGGAVFVRAGFNTNGEVRLWDVDVGGNLVVICARFAEGSCINAQGATVRGAHFWRGMPNTPVALDLNHASVGPIGDDKASWPQQGRLKLDGCVYSRFATDPKDAKSRLEWLNRQRPNEFRPQPFQQLAKVLREDGDNVGARRVLVAMEDQRRKYGNLSFLPWLWRWILGATIRYGYQPWYVLRCVAFVVILGWILFTRGYDQGVITPTDKDAYQIFEAHPHPKQGNHGDPPPYYVEFSAPVYSLDTFLPIINLGQKDHWMPNPHEGGFGEILRDYLWIHIGLGWLLTTLFVAGLTPIVRSG